MIARQAELVAQWLLVGFIHGVMNTDNMSIAGETIDYGPCAFMDAYRSRRRSSAPSTIAGRYAYGNQPRIAHWNLARFAETLLPLLGDDEDAAMSAAQEALDSFRRAFRGRLSLRVCGASLACADGARRATSALAQDLLQRMAQNEADFTLTFRRLARCAPPGRMAMPLCAALFADPAAFDGWAARGASGWRAKTARHRCGAPRRHAGGQPRLHPAQPPGGGGHRGCPELLRFHAAGRAAERSRRAL